MPVQAKPGAVRISPLVQRQEDEEEAVQTKQLIQRQTEEEETVQAKRLIQRQTEEEETVQTKPIIQRQAEEEETVQSKSIIQRQAEEEETVQAKPVIQRQVEEEEPVQPKPIIQRQAEEEEMLQPKSRIQRQTEEDEPIQRTGDGLSGISPATAATIHSPGPGVPMPTAVRQRIEPHINADLSGVRIHSGPAASNAAASIQARAFTHGSDIFLNRNESSSDLPLMAHESTHVVQQGAAVASASAMPGLQPAACAPGGCIQKDGEEDESSGILGGLVSFGWSAFRVIAPAQTVSLLEDISRVGIVGYLRERLGGVFNHIFDGLGNSSAAVGRIIEMFSMLISRAGAVLSALGSGDCQPLFQAMNELKEIVSQMAGDAWDAVKEFFRPVGEFFSDLWESFGAPAVDWVRERAAEYWEFIQDVGRTIWGLTEPIREFYGTLAGNAWQWIKEQLGIPESTEDDSEGGIMQWVQDQLGNAWEYIQEQLRPVIEPLQGVARRVMDFLPITAILNLRETIQEWMQQVTNMAAAMEQEEGVVEEQVSLRDEILPAVLQTIGAFRQRLIGAGQWVSGQIGGLVGSVQGLMESIRTNPILRVAGGAIQWLQDRAAQLGEWAQSSVMDLFNFVGDGLVYLSRFIRPILDTLQQLVELLGDLIGKLPDLVLGPVWRAIPRCIRDPVMNFIINNILRHIPIFGQLMEIPNIWDRVRDTALRILRRIFVDGDLLRAAWVFFRSILEILGLPPELVIEVIQKAAQAISDILNDPVGFFINLVRAMGRGFQRFFDNIGQHLLGGLTGWLFGQLQSAGITPPSDISFGSILRLVLQVLDISVDRIFSRLEARVGQQVVANLRRAMNFMTGAWEWVSALIHEGPGGIWRMVQERISDLWDQVRNSIVNWISQTIITRVAQRLLTMLDPTGIGAAINLIVTIYDAVRSFMEYLERILRIVNSVLDGVNDIARGSYERAAEFLESALSRAIPVAIGFLANMLHLGNLGRRIREMIESVRRRVDQAIDWLIERAINMGQAVLRALGMGGRDEEGEAEVVTDGEMIAIHTSFETGEEEHEINNRENSFQLLLSSPTTTLLDTHPNQEVRDAYATYLREIEQAASPTAKREAANRNLRIIVDKIKAAGAANAPGASAPGIGTIDLHKNQQSRLQTSNIVVWHLESEHVIPRGFVNAAFEALAQAGVPAGSADYRNMHTILIYLEAADLKTKGSSGDTSTINDFKTTLREIINEVFVTHQRSPGAARGEMVDATFRLLNTFSSDAQERTNIAIEAENRNNGVTRGPAGSPETPTPTASEVNRAYTLQRDDINNQLEARINAFIADRVATSD
ncbi:MAG: DUF4157 domain-containing protein [Calditrichaeota bacterium]|nr:DUF4157 domain-containing protein [Calditrichota bacterium]MCB9088592.1 DUF4157 domain-containing protein [Calditrichia bacterium]